MGIRPSFFGIEIGKTGIMVSQIGLDVTGHNIANVDTAGYTRQRLVTSSYEPYGAITRFRPVNMALVGSGTYIKILDQVRSKFLDDQYRKENTLLGDWQTRTQGLSYLESLFETNDFKSLNKPINDLFAAFNVENAEANDLEQRKVIQQAAISLTTEFNQLYQRMVDQQEDQNVAVKAVADEVNTILGNIAMLNETIYSYELLGNQPANDLRDRRNLLLDRLSYLTDIQYTGEVFSPGGNANEVFTLTIGGVEVINHNVVKATLDCSNTVKDPITGIDKYDLQWVDASGNAVTSASGTSGVAPDELGGELKAHLNLRDSDSKDSMGIPYFIKQVNTLAQALVQIINEQHSLGWTHTNNSSGVSQTGQFFFEVGTGGINAVNAGNIKLDAAILDDVYNIAASSNEIGAGSGNTLQKGNQENMRAIYELLSRKDLSLDLGGGTTVPIGGFNNFMSGILLDMSITLQHSKTNTTNQNTQVSSVDYQRTSISGVSLDEEMTNLIKYQHAYNGSSRVITAMDEALEKIINGTGLVGR